MTPTTEGLQSDKIKLKKQESLLRPTYEFEMNIMLEIFFFINLLLTLSVLII